MKHERIFLDPSDDRVYIDTYIAEDKSVTREAMLVIPGGGYGVVCHEREGEPVALAYLARGFNTFVLNYRVGTDRYPDQLIDASRAIVYIKRHAEEFGIDARRVYACGFSAGGHLAGSLAILWNEPRVAEVLGIGGGENRPRACVLSYPVVSAWLMTHTPSVENLIGAPYADIGDEDKDRISLERNVNDACAPLFIWHTAEDEVVPPIGSLTLCAKYIEQGLPVSLHVYPYGPHGLSLADHYCSCNLPQFVQPMAQGWVDESVAWLRSLK